MACTRGFGSDAEKQAAVNALSSLRSKLSRPAMEEKSARLTELKLEIQTTEATMEDYRTWSSKVWVFVQEFGCWSSGLSFQCFRNKRWLRLLRDWMTSCPLFTRCKRKRTSLIGCCHDCVGLHTRNVTQCCFRACPLPRRKLRLPMLCYQTLSL